MNELEIKGKLKSYAEILNSLYSEGIVRVLSVNVVLTPVKI